MKKKQAPTATGTQNTQFQTSLTPSSKILVLDPSFVFGWAVLENYSLLDFGCLKKDKKDLLTFSGEFNTLLSDLVKKHGITHVITEIPVGSKNYNAVKALAFCNGMVFSTISNLKLQVKLFQPKAAKKLVGGKANLDKDQVIDLVEVQAPSIFSKIKDKPKYVKETIADCILLYLAALGSTNGH